MKAFWPVGEAAQADYEALREIAIAGRPLRGIAAARFERRGLAGLIAWPAAEPVFAACVAGAARPPWTPHGDPRLDILAVAYEFILECCAEIPEAVEVQG